VVGRVASFVQQPLATPKAFASGRRGQNQSFSETPDFQDEATSLVLQQAELLRAE
jgi:hypothetical protein